MKQVTGEYLCDFCGEHIPTTTDQKDHLGKVVFIRNGGVEKHDAIDLCTSCYENMKAYCANHKKDKPAQIEFPAYNIFFRQDGMWILYGGPLIQKTYKEVQGIAHDLLFSSNNTDAVRIYGIFQSQMNFISESKKKDLAKPSGSRIVPESAIKMLSEVRDSMFAVGLDDWYQTASKGDILMKRIQTLRGRIAKAMNQIADEERKPGRIELMFDFIKKILGMQIPW